MRVTVQKTTPKKEARRIVSAAANTVRRSFALPRHVVTEATAVAPAELQDNLNRLVTTALQEYTETRKRRTFEAAMAAMAADPAIHRASAELLTAFRTTEADGLPND
jgi:hypothetical protein